MSSLSDKVTGTTKEMTGKITNNDRLEAEGKIQKTKGEVEGKVDEAKDTFAEKIDRRDSTDTRDSLENEPDTRL